MKKGEIVWVVRSEESFERETYRHLDLYVKKEDAVAAFKESVRLAKEAAVKYGYEYEDPVIDEEIEIGNAYHSVWNDGEYVYNHIDTELYCQGVY